MNFVGLWSSASQLMLNRLPHRMYAGLCSPAAAQHFMYWPDPQSCAAGAEAEASCKSVFALALLQRLGAEGHKALVFSQSRRMLDVLGAKLQLLGVDFLHIDGTLKASERQAWSPSSSAVGESPGFRILAQAGWSLTLIVAQSWEFRLCMRASKAPTESVSRSRG